jgi:hypothetical protein
MTGTLCAWLPIAGAGAAGVPTDPLGNGVSPEAASPHAASRPHASAPPNNVIALSAVMTSRVPDYLYGV